jgi:UDP-N-acetylglucosamine diphosphorylase / glucose-1-phosphate thymidylyltransferase / UDP-N-acetylgalactosamine diphosphorylase / glucosamine-1-phosphate N-acetyltransferase / galactosamine-1-phosphate N-acetyltransferase
LKLIFRKANHCLESFIDKEECPASSLKLLGQHLIIRNIKLVSKIFAIKKIMIPEEFRNALKLVQDYFPSINTEEFYDDFNNIVDHDPSIHSSNGNINTPSFNSATAATPVGKIRLKGNEESFQIPLNAVLHYPALPSSDTKSLLVDSVVYPWDFLNIIHKTLHEEVTHTVISPNASVAKSSIISGPCIIEDEVTVDDFCKIKGPTYISKGSFIGMSSLIRNCMFGSNTRIGFNCEIGKSYFAGDDKISHQNVILDSMIGKNVWFGGYSGTANVLLNRKNVKYEIGNGQLIDTGTDHFGAVVGNNCAVGASVIILPGRRLAHNTVIQAGTIFGKQLSDQEIYLRTTDRRPQIPSSPSI